MPTKKKVTKPWGQAQRPSKKFKTHHPRHFMPFSMAIYAPLVLEDALKYGQNASLHSVDAFPPLPNPSPASSDAFPCPDKAFLDA